LKGKKQDFGNIIMKRENYFQKEDIKREKR